jgi:hypothetical protein
MENSKERGSASTSMSAPMLRAVLALLLLVSAVQSTKTEWTQRNSVPTSSQISGLALGRAGMVLATGSDNLIMTSFDNGTTWVCAASSLPCALLSL